MQRMEWEAGRALPRVRSVNLYWMLGWALTLLLSVVGLVIDALLRWTIVVGMILLLVALSSLVGVVMYTLNHIAARQGKHTIQGILTNPQTVHWVYSQDEWQHYTTRSWRRGLRYLLILLGVGVALQPILVVASYANAPDSPDVFARFAAGLGIVGGLALFLFVGMLLQRQIRRHRTTSEVYISPAGIILNGWYYALVGAAGHLKAITCRSGDPGKLFLRVGSGRASNLIEVLVPRGREAEAVHVARSLQAVFPGCKVYLH